MFHTGIYVSFPSFLRPCALREKEMATHSSVLAWRIPGTGEPGGLLSMGSHRVGQEWCDVAAAAAAAYFSQGSSILKPVSAFTSFFRFILFVFYIKLELYRIPMLQSPNIVLSFFLKQIFDIESVILRDPFESLKSTHFYLSLFFCTIKS